MNPIIVNLKNGERAYISAFRNGGVDFTNDKRFAICGRDSYERAGMVSWINRTNLVGVTYAE